MSDKDQKIFIQIARNSVESFINNSKLDLPEAPGEQLQADRGVFVTLKLDGQLRGCIGCIEPPGKPLYKSVAEMSRSAAFDDPRFPPLRKDELPLIQFEISVITKPEKIASYKDIELGKHGVIVDKNGQSGVFLPQVAEETGWSIYEFMSELCAQKAGLAPDAYKNDPELDIYVFEVEKIEE